MIDEILDIVSAEDVVIGQEKRTVIYQQGLSCFRVINGFICNDANKLWIPIRHPGKKLFPLHFDASVGGHVMAGESYEDAFLREVQEELGLELSRNECVPVARLTPHTHGTSAFMWVYLIRSNDVPSYNKNDFIDYRWFSAQELLERIAQGYKAKSDLAPIVKAIKDII